MISFTNWYRVEGIVYGKVFFALQRVPGEGLQTILLFVTTCQNEDSSNNEFQIHTTTKILD